MSFKITARTILHLGAELISSDGIAFYELIKNAFDAGSKEVQIRVVIRLSYIHYKDFRTLLLEKKSSSKISDRLMNDIKEEIIDEVDNSAPNISTLKENIEGSDSITELLHALDSANYIIISDTGEGMSLEDLNDNYLTIGTRSRYLQQENQKKKYIRSEVNFIEESIRPILGEKGVGRLSVMRLGSKLRVKTKKTDESHWNYLKIDWSRFSHESDQLLEEIKIKPKRGKKIIDKRISGTKITITGLESDWTKEKLHNIARNEFSKLTDPFTPKVKYPINIKYNDEEIETLRFDELLLDIAHSFVQAEYSVNNGAPELNGQVDYLLHHKSKKFHYSKGDLRSICNQKSLTTLNSLGPFNMMFYWFNRRLLKGIDGIGSQQYIRNIVAQWSGGLMVFRDGFRINPYGNPEDDWLSLDKEAFRSSGFKLNRRQVIGKVDISVINNPKLKDQTNREGLVENDEKKIMVTILQHVLFTEFKVFTDSIDTEMKVIERVSFRDLESKVEAQEEEISNNINLLVKEYKIPRKSHVIVSIEDSIENIKDLLNKAKDLASIHEDDKSKYLHLAGLGLMSEILAHELNRASSNILATLKKFNKANLSSNIIDQLNTLSSQIKTLQKRLKILDPLSTRGRQVKENFDLVSWVEDNISAHENQFLRHDIKKKFKVKPFEDSTLKIKAVKGMIVQILENLIDNSVYWIKEYKKTDKYYKPEITLVIDTRNTRLYFSDNGPGIPPERKEEVFLPFFSTKPFKVGKGLGLYISREIAEYNDAKLYLSEKSKNNLGNLNTFVLEVHSLE